MEFVPPATLIAAIAFVALLIALLAYGYYKSRGR